MNEYQAPQACVLTRRMETAADQATGYAEMSSLAKTAEAAGMMRRLSPGG